jgi:hypothetical protein
MNKYSIELLDSVYSELINNDCHDEEILSLIDDLQNKIEDFYNTKKEEN